MIILVGHTTEKMQHTLSLLPKSLDRVLVFNGSDPFPGAIHTKNTSNRDIAMYFKGLNTTDWDTAIFINDDVQYISPEFWNIELSEDIAGVGNLATWIPDHMQNNHTLKQGRSLRFIRTSAFIAKRDYFLKNYLACRGNAQKFEKSTLHTNSFNILSPLTYYDSNVKEYYYAISR